MSHFDTLMHRKHIYSCWFSLWLGLSRIYKSLGCPQGCGDGVTGPQGDHLRLKGQNCLQRLHKLNPPLFHKFFRDTVRRRPLQETVDFLHAFLGFCVDPTVIANSPQGRLVSAVRAGFFFIFVCAEIQSTLLEQNCRVCCCCFLLLHFLDRSWIYWLSFLLNLILHIANDQSDVSFNFLTGQGSTVIIVGGLPWASRFSGWVTWMFRLLAWYGKWRSWALHSRETWVGESQSIEQIHLCQHVFHSQL